MFVTATYIDNAVFAQRVVRNQIGWQILDFFDFLIFAQRQQGVEQTDDQVRMFAEDTFERQVCLWIQIFHS